jgi:hypothetical protein
MGSLGLHADPEGWLNAGYSIRTLMESLESELYDADRIGGAGLSQSWAGPVAEAFTGHWSGLRSRAEDLIAQGRRAAAAITGFGGRLEDFVRRAADLESYWLSFGLQLGLDGMHFVLPWGFEQLQPAHQISFHQWLSESERDVTAMWSDIRAAVDDVVTALESLIAAFEDFAVLELGAAAGLIGGDLGGYCANWASAVSDGLTAATAGLDWARNHVLDEAYKKVIAASEDASHDMQAVADTATKDALRTAAVAGKFDRVAKVGAPWLYGATVLWTVGQTVDSAVVQHRGWLNGVEDNAGAWAGLAAGIAVVTLAPVSAPVLGVVLLSGIVGYGVGQGAQMWVNDNRASINQGFTDIGRGAQVIAKAVGRGVEDAASWEAEHAKGLAKFL